MVAQSLEEDVQDGSTSLNSDIELLIGSCFIILHSPPKLIYSVGIQKIM